MNKYFVYQHIRNDKNYVFYIGIGKINPKYPTYKMQHYRAYSKSGRNPIWKNITNKTSYTVEIIEDNLNFEEVKNKEIELIQYYGKLKSGGLLSNISDGGETVKEELITVLNDPKCSQPVYQYTIEGNFLKEWPSTNEIKRQLGYDNSVIRKALKGKTKSPNISYGYQWFTEYKGPITLGSDFGKTTLHKKVKVSNGDVVLFFNSRQECATYFKVESAQITNAIRTKGTVRKFKIENND